MSTFPRDYHSVECFTDESIDSLKKDLQNLSRALATIASGYGDEGLPFTKQGLQVHAQGALDDLPKNSFVRKYLNLR